MDDTWKHLLIFLSGSSVFVIVAHAVNTFPTPQNVYGQWLLGIVKFAVGQRISGANAIAGMQTTTVAVTTEQKAQLANGSTLKMVDTHTGQIQSDVNVK